MAIEEAQHTSKKRIVPMIASEPAVKRAINILYGNEGAAEAMAQMQAETAAAQEVRQGQGQMAERERQENVTPMTAWSIRLLSVPFRKMLRISILSRRRRRWSSGCVSTGSFIGS